MNRKNPLEYPIVIVKWDDHTSLDSWIADEDIVKSVSPAIIVSVGWLIHETDKAVFIAGGRSDDNSWTSVQTILKSALVKKVVLAK